MYLTQLLSNYNNFLPLKTSCRLGCWEERLLPSQPKFKSHFLFSGNHYALLDFFSFEFSKMLVGWVVGRNEYYHPHLSSNITFFFSSNYYAFFFLNFCKMWVDWVVGSNECYIPHLSSNLTCSLLVIIMHFYIQTQTVTYPKLQKKK